LRVYKLVEDEETIIQMVLFGSLSNHQARSIGDFYDNSISNL